MNKWKSVSLTILYVLLVLGITKVLHLVSEQSQLKEIPHRLILSATEYQGQATLWQELKHRVQVQPFNLVAFIIFCLTLIHIFLSTWFTALSEKLRANREEKDSFWVEICHFMGEVEVIFGLWVIPLMLAMTLMYNWKLSLDYLNGISYTEALFVFVIMVLASTKPIVSLAEDILSSVAKIGGKTVKSWWLAILTFGPLLGSFITEPAAMTISAILLGEQFYRYKPSNKFAYATLGLLFTNISVGGVLTNFAAPPVLMVSSAWGFSSYHMLVNFGWKAVLGILISNVLYYLYFSPEFSHMQEKKELSALDKEEKQQIPFWISLFHITFLAWIVVHGHYPVVFVGSFLLYLGLFTATSHYQYDLKLKTPLLVGFFLAGLIVQGSLQAWWMAPILERAKGEVLMILCIILTAFNDNAEITFLASLTPNLSDSLKYFALAGAVTGGGLTVIANAPNLSGQALLSPYFKRGVSVVSLFLGALVPTIIMAICFYVLRPH